MNCYHCGRAIADTQKSIAVIVVEKAGGRLGSTNLHCDCTAPSLSRYRQCIEWHGQFGNLETFKSLHRPLGARPNNQCGCRRGPMERRSRTALGAGASSCDELTEIVSSADQRPFIGHFVDAAQKKLSKASRLFDLAKDRFDDLLAQPIDGGQRASVCLASPARAGHPLVSHHDRPDARRGQRPDRREYCVDVARRGSPQSKSRRPRRSRAACGRYLLWLRRPAERERRGHRDCC